MYVENTISVQGEIFSDGESARTYIWKSKAIFPLERCLYRNKLVIIREYYIHREYYIGINSDLSIREYYIEITVVESHLYINISFTSTTIHNNHT